MRLVSKRFVNRKLFPFSMLIKTHIIFAFCIALLAIPYFHPSNQILFLLLVLFGAMLPDIDHPKSMLGSKVKIIPLLFTHRGFFHSLLILPVLSVLLMWLLGTSRFTLPLLVGYVSHLFGDMITMEGIKPFSPLSNWTWRGGVFRVGGPVEYMLLGGLVLASGWLLIH